MRKLWKQKGGSKMSRKTPFCFVQNSLRFYRLHKLEEYVYVITLAHWQKGMTKAEV